MKKKLLQAEEKRKKTKTKKKEKKKKKKTREKEVKCVEWKRWPASGQFDENQDKG
jgi:hypothetical protein